LQAGTTTYASAFQYAAHGAVSQATLGNTLVEKTTFNNRLQPTEIMLGPGGNVFDLQYSYATQGQNNNNGNLLEQKIYVGGTSGTLVGDQACGYDKLNRLISVTETYNNTTSLARTFNYDQFGNMWVTGAQGVVPTAATPQASTAYTAGTNQLASPAAYDPAGNQTFDLVGNHCLYDGENRLTDFANGTGGYAYDGDGRRVTKTASARTSVFVYDIAGKLIAEYAGPTSTSNAGTSYLTTDHLGSTRVVTNSLGNVVARHDYLPFREEITAPNIGGRTAGMGYGATDDTHGRSLPRKNEMPSPVWITSARDIVHQCRAGSLAPMPSLFPRDG
jgi:YD repeat-containing protein